MLYLYKAVPRLRECCSQVEAEEEQNSANLGMTFLRFPVQQRKAKRKARSRAAVETREDEVERRRRQTDRKQQRRLNSNLAVLVAVVGGVEWRGPKRREEIREGNNEMSSMLCLQSPKKSS